MFLFRTHGWNLVSPRFNVDGCRALRGIVLSAIGGAGGGGSILRGMAAPGGESGLGGRGGGGGGRIRTNTTPALSSTRFSAVRGMGAVGAAAAAAADRTVCVAVGATAGTAAGSGRYGS